MSSPSFFSGESSVWARDRERKYFSSPGVPSPRTSSRVFIQCIERKNWRTESVSYCKLFWHTDTNIRWNWQKIFLYRVHRIDVDNKRRIRGAKNLISAAALIPVNTVCTLSGWHCMHNWRQVWPQYNDVLFPYNTKVAQRYLISLLDYNFTRVNSVSRILLQLWCSVLQSE